MGSVVVVNENGWTLSYTKQLAIRALSRVYPKDTWGAIHQLLSIILNLRILVLFHVSTLPYVVKVKN
jgi:hypothetical protein